MVREIFIDEIEKIIADFNLKSKLCRSYHEFLLNLVLRGVNSSMDLFRVVNELVYYTVVKFLSKSERFCKQAGLGHVFMIYNLIVVK